MFSHIFFLTPPLYENTFKCPKISHLKWFKDSNIFATTGLPWLDPFEKQTYLDKCLFRKTPTRHRFMQSKNGLGP